MKKKLFSVYIEAKTDFGIDFIESVLKSVVQGLNQFKKSYRVSILPMKDSLKPKRRNR